MFLPNSINPSLIFILQLVCSNLPLSPNSINPSLILGQPDKSFLILDSTNYQAVPYANIVVRPKMEGTISDETGKAKLKNINFTDTILINALGYIPKKYMGKNLPDTILLARKYFSIPEITINATPFRQKLKKRPKLTARICNWYDQGFQIVAFIPAPPEPRKIESIEVFIRGKIMVKGKIRLRLYHPDNSGQPGEDLLQQSLIVDAQGLKGWLKFNLQEIALNNLQNGFFAGLEFLDFPDNKEKYVCLGLSNQIPAYQTWQKFLGKSWYLADFLKDQKNKPLNIMVIVNYQ